MLPARLLIIMLLTLQVFGSTIPPPAILEKNGLLGYSLELPSLDFMSSFLPLDATEISKPLRDECVVQTRRDSTTKDESYYRTTKQIYNSFTTETRVDPDLASHYSLQGSINAVTDSLSSKDSFISGYSLKMYANAFSRSIAKPCINNFEFTDGFLNDFEKLPNDFINSDRFWQHYIKFFEKYGTHVVREVTYGASITQYSFAKVSKSYTQNDFKIKSCMALGKYTKPDTTITKNIDACRDVSSNDIERVKKFEMTDKLVIRGGTFDSRIKLLSDRSDDKIRTFLSEDFIELLPIKYAFVELWTILKLKFFGTPYYARARTLEDFFKGKLNYGCGELKLNGFVVQRFVRAPGSGNDNPTYECQIMRQGCLNGDVDCHYRGVPATCSCNGPSCVEYTFELTGDAITKIIPYAYQRGERGVSGGCEYQYVPAECHCKRGQRYDAVWKNTKSF